jgi:hypothetical protein
MYALDEQQAEEIAAENSATWPKFNALKAKLSHQWASVTSPIQPNSTNYLVKEEKVDDLADATTVRVKG